MKEIKLKINTSTDMVNLGFSIGSLAYPNMLIAMNGDLGAGKTTLTKGIGQALGITRVINSPTFTIMKVYEGKLNLYHLDVYRIENADSDFELEEYFYLGGVSVVEWADNIKPILPDDTIKLQFDISSDASREVTVQAQDEFIEQLLKKIGE